MIEGNADRDFEAESDGHTLMQAEEIKGDHGRFHKALKHVQKQTKQHNKARRALEAHAATMQEGNDGRQQGYTDKAEDENTENYGGGEY